jgi:hypothetical protein
VCKYCLHVIKILNIYLAKEVRHIILPLLSVSLIIRFFWPVLSTKDRRASIKPWVMENSSSESGRVFDLKAARGFRTCIQK